MSVTQIVQLSKSPASDHARDIFRSAPGPFGGRIVIEPDGTIDIITFSQPGVFRYGGDGKLKEVLGKSIDELVLESMKEAGVLGTEALWRRRFAVAGRPWPSTIAAPGAGERVRDNRPGDRRVRRSVRRGNHRCRPWDALHSRSACARRIPCR